MKFAICNEVFEGWEIDKVLEFVSKIGYEGIEIAPFTLAQRVTLISKEERKELKNKIKKYNLEFVGLHWLLVSPKGLYINHPDKSLREETKKYFFELIKFCSLLDGKIMVIGSPKQRNVVNDISYQDAWNFAREVFSEWSKVAEDEGVILCLEPLAKTETNFINTHTEAIKMIREVNSKNFRLLLDVKAMCDENIPIQDIIKESKEYLAHFHANDVNLREPGSGDVDFVPIFKTLKEINYSGYVSIEVFDFKEGPEKIATNGLSYLKEVFDNIS